jgi:transposase
MMRGFDKRPGELFSYVDLEKRVRLDHPLRAIRALTDSALGALSGDFAALYSGLGRPSIAPEMLLRSMLLQAFYSVRSERQLMERLEFDLLFRWFVGLGIDDPVWDHSVFSKNRDRLLEGEIAAKFLTAVLAQPRIERLLSSEHFSVDGTLIEAWASMKSFRPKQPPDGGGTPDGTMGGGRNAPADFRGEKRSNQTHQSTTDPDARLYRKGPGMEAKLCFIGHGLMENRSGLIVDARLTRVSGHAERLAALDMIEGCADRPRAVNPRRRQGVRYRRFRRGIAHDQRAPACRAQYQRPTLGDRPAHHAPSRLCREPAHPQADRGGVRLDQDGCRLAQDQVARPAQGRLELYLRRSRLQSGAGAEADRGGEMSAAAGCELIGRWRIVEADLWDSDYLDLVEPAYMSFGKNGRGEFAFGVVNATMELGYGQRIVFFNWTGFDEGDEICGSGSAELEDDGTIEIELSFHNGDDAILKARRE